MTSPTASVWYEFGRTMVRRLIDEGENGTAPSWDAFDAALDDDSIAFTIIARNAGLSRIESAVLATLAAAEVDPVLHRAIARFQGDASRNRLTLGTLLDLFAFDGSEHSAPPVLALGTDSRLRSAGLVDVVSQGPWTDHVAAVHPSVVWALVGDHSRDPDLPRVVAHVDTDLHDGAPFVLVGGTDRLRRRQRGAEASAGQRFLVVDAPADEAAWMALVRECTLTGSGAIVEIDAETLPPTARRVVERAPHVTWVLSAARDVPFEDLPHLPWVSVHAEPDPVSDDEWDGAFGGDVERTHPLRAEQLEMAARTFEAEGRDLDAAVRRLTSGRLDRLATRIRPRRTWDDLVITPDRKRLLHTVVERYLHTERVLGDWAVGGPQATGTIALFAGPSGTGKTMATEVIAGELGLDVFRLDVSSVVSKYIGETEKNLDAIFDAASGGNLVLFFDEADALFGKRSEVKDARDRYANIEVSYLLQRVEMYDGLIVLATNFEKNIDQAFLRRIHVRVEFNIPGPDERRKIWRQMFPDEAPLDEIDLDWVADSFEIAGGVIRNAAVHAGFIAASAGSPITTDTIVLGIAREFRKLGRLVKEDDFGPYIGLVTDVDA